jgi:hypothetical protein
MTDDASNVTQLRSVMPEEAHARRLVGRRMSRGKGATRQLEDRGSSRRR